MRVRVLLFVVLFVVATAKLPFFEYDEANAFERGVLLGSRFSREISQVLEQDPSLPQLEAWANANATTWSMIWDNQVGFFFFFFFFVLSMHYSAFHVFSYNVSSYLTQRSMFPHLCREIDGVAFGSNQSALRLRLSNMEVDLVTMLPWVQEPLKCSDVVSNVLGHNEDDDTFFLGRCALIRDHVLGWTGFWYPGQLVGNAYGWNWRHGIAFSSNELSPVSYNMSGAGYYFLTRSAFEANSFKDAIRRITAYPAFSGFSFNIASAQENLFGNVEVFLDQFQVTSAPLAHFNSYLFMNVSQYPDSSSAERMARYEALGKPTSIEGIRQFLSDDQVFRHNFQGESTLSSFIVNTVENVVHIFDNSLPNSTSLYQMPLFEPLAWSPPSSLWNSSWNTWEPNLCLLNGVLTVFSTWLQPSDQTQAWAPAIVTKASKDLGVSFSKSLFLENDPSIPGGQADPVCSTDFSSGTMFAAWMDNWCLSVAATQDGFSWSSPVMAVKTLNNSSEVRNGSTLQFADKPWIIASPREVNLVFNSQFPYAVTSADHGQTWGEPFLMDDEILDPYYYWYAGGGGTFSDGSCVSVFVVIPNNDPPFDKTKPFGFVRAYFKEISSGWNASTVAVMMNPMLQECPVSAQCNDRYEKGKNKLCRLEIFERWEFLSSGVTAAVHESTVYVVWAQGDVAGLGQILFSFSSNKGQSWSTPVQLNPQYAPGEIVFSGFPTIAVAHLQDSFPPKTEVFFGWMSNATGMWNTYVLAKNTTQIISNSFVFPFGDYWKLLADAETRSLFAIWGQSINGWFLNGTTMFAQAKF